MEATGAPQSSTVDPVDLTNDATLTRLLLDGTRLWRQRLVEQFTFEAEDMVRVSSSYQIELTSGFLEEVELIGPGVRRIRCILPLSTRPKASLLGFGLESPDGAHVRLLLRRDIAALECGYLLELWENGPIRGNHPCPEFLEAIVGFHAGRYQRSVDSEVLPDEGLSQHLSANLPFRCSPLWVEEWQAKTAPVADVLATALGEARDSGSAAEYPLLALADVEPVPASADAAERLLQAYQSSIQSAQQAGDDVFLEALAEYGRRWAVLVETEIPLDQPVVLRISEDRHLDLDWRRRTRIHLALGEAWSYHLEARVADHAVELVDARYRSPSGEQVPAREIEDRRDRPKSLAMYSSIWGRPEHAHLEVGLRTSPDQRLAGRLVLTLTAAALVAASLVPFGTSTVESLALLTVPTTFAAALVLTRDESPLAGRLQRRLRWVLAVITTLLWLVAIGRLLDSPDVVSPSNQPPFNPRSSAIQSQH